MAIVRKLERVSGLAEARHSEADCTYAIWTDEEGDRWLQIDTYGSRQRKLLEKKSQSMRFAPEAVAQLKRILAEEIA